MNLHIYTGGAVQTNGYLLETDLGWITIDAPSGISEFAQDHQLTIHALLLTHQHFDHVEAAHQLKDIHAYSPCDRSLIMDQRAKDWGLPVAVPDFDVSKQLKDLSSLSIAGLHFELLHVPGHSPDSLAFYLPEEKLLFAGDTLFAGGVGRTDLPGGNHEQLMTSIRQKLFSLPNEVTVYPGHGPSTTIGEEKQHNPYVRV